MIKLGAST